MLRPHPIATQFSTFHKKPDATTLKNVYLYCWLYIHTSPVSIKMLMAPFYVCLIANSYEMLVVFCEFHCAENQLVIVVLEKREEEKNFSLPIVATGCF